MLLRTGAVRWLSPSLLLLLLLLVLLLLMPLSWQMQSDLKCERLLVSPSAMKAFLL